MGNQEDDELAEKKQEALVVFQSFLETYHSKEIDEILLSENVSEHYSLHVNALDFFNINMDIGNCLLKQPQQFLPIFDTALCNTEVSQMEKAVHLLTDDASTTSYKPNVHIRISNLPVCSELTRVSIPKSADIGSFLANSGTLIRTSLSKLLEFEKEYMCNKCKHVFTVQADLEQYYAFPKPTACPSPEPCNSVKFTCFSGGNKSPTNYKDYQEIKIQEQVQKLSVGTIPRSTWVILEDDLVDMCKPGDDVTVYGTVMQRWQPVSKDSKCNIELVMKANNIVVNNDQQSAATLTEELKREFQEFWQLHSNHPLHGRNEILTSFCPQVFGLYVVKLSVALALIGGVQHVSESGTRTRGESHLLLVGDPGTGKSQFLKYAAKLMPRSVLTTGIGSTNAGLTVTAVKDSGEWQLEAGALVLADGGLCCIDEFNSIREHDKASIHEAMEQQTISVAKAGLVCKLNTRTTILAASNPKGNYDSEEPLSVNVALASPLLSRFDIVLVLLDNRNEEWERIVSSFVLRGARPGLDASKVKKEFWSLDKMQAYICYVKTIKPVLTPDSNRVLRSYYTAQRSADSRNAARTTVRLLESMVRIAQAHAKLLCRDKVTVQDAVVAVCVIESSMQNTALFGKGLNPLHTVFPQDPDAEYIKQARIVLKKLQLHDILKQVLEKEDERLKIIAGNRENMFEQSNASDVLEDDNIKRAARPELHCANEAEKSSEYSGMQGRREEGEIEDNGRDEERGMLAMGGVDADFRGRFQQEKQIHSTPFHGVSNFFPPTPNLDTLDNNSNNSTFASANPKTKVCEFNGECMNVFKNTPSKLLHDDGNDDEFLGSNINHLPGNIFKIDDDDADIDCGLMIGSEWPISGFGPDASTYVLPRMNVSSVSSATNCVPERKGTVQKGDSVPGPSLSLREGLEEKAGATNSCYNEESNIAIKRKRPVSVLKEMIKSTGSTSEKLKRFKFK
eukprot:gene20029-21992_t